jgi:hypothetical protein
MPSLPGRSCATPRCRNPAVKGSRCAACERAKQSHIDRRRDGSTDRGYDEVHRRLRVLCFVRDNWKCVDCGWQPDIIVDCEEHQFDEPPVDAILEALRVAFNRGERHLHADHDQPVEQRPDLRTDLDNYKTRCNRCHSAKTMRELNASR